MSINSLSGLLELALLKFDQTYETARAKPLQSGTPEVGVWRSASASGGGLVQTLFIRLDNDVLEVKRYPGANRHSEGDIWLYGVPGFHFKFHLSSRLDGSGMRAALTSTGRDVPEADIPPELFVRMEHMLNTI